MGAAAVGEALLEVPEELRTVVGEEELESRGKPLAPCIKGVPGAPAGPEWLPASAFTLPPAISSF